MYRPISVQLSSTIEADDLIRALRLFLAPWGWQEGVVVEDIELWFRNNFNCRFAYSFNSGRSAEYAILKALGIGKGDEILLQAFTCVAVPNSILWLGAKPVYVDIEEGGYTMSLNNLQQKITKRSKAIIIQHTFGYPDRVEKIKKIAKKYGLFLIEDCAHSLGNKIDGKLIGSFGDAAFFSFGRDKVVSSVFGGMAISSSEEMGKKLKNLVNQLRRPSHIWIARQLLHPLAFSVILPLYKIQLGKFLLYILQKMRVLSKPVEKKEYYGIKPSNYPQRQANALASLAFGQLQKLTFFQKKRLKAAKIYRQYLKKLPIELPPEADQALIRFPICVSNPDSLVEAAQKKGIILSRWYSNIIDPLGIDLNRVGYVYGSCPQAESQAKRVVNLPTAPVLRKEEIMRVVEFLRSYYESKKEADS